MFVTSFLARQTRYFLPLHCNTTIKQQLCGEEWSFLLSLLQADGLQEKQGILQQIKLYPSIKPKKRLYQVFWDK